MTAISREQTGLGLLRPEQETIGGAKTALPNPKDLFGAKKTPLSALPPIAQIEGSMAMEDGAYKYGPYNWREHPVQCRIYIDAIKRHVMAFEDGEECAGDSLVKHLGHVIACCGIILDAQLVGNLIDDRKKTGKIAAYLTEQEKLLTKKKEQRAKKDEEAGIAKFQGNVELLRNLTKLIDADRTEPNVDANMSEVRTVLVQGSPKDSTDVPVRLDVGTVLKKESDRFAADVCTSRFHGRKMA